MKVVIKAIKEHRRTKRELPKKGTSAFCAIMEQAADTALSVLDRSRGVVRGRADRLAQIRQYTEFRDCARGLSVFAIVGLPPFEPSIRQAEDYEVSGAYETYLAPMDAAVQGSDGSVASVTSRVNAVLADAVSAEIPQGDLLALASFANVIESSAAEWNAYDPMGSGPSDCGTADGCWEMSVFPLQAGSNIRKVIGADALGCLSTVTGWKALRLLLVGPAWAALAGECGARAVIASAFAIYML